MKNIFRFRGIKCDSCDFKDESVPFSEYESYLNKKCPICGAPLLTQEDYDKCVQIMSLGEKISQMIPEPDKHENGRRMVLRIPIEKAKNLFLKNKS